MKWEIDFDKKHISGDVAIILDVKQDTDKIVLDTRDLTVKSAELFLNDQPAKTGFVLEDNQALGQKLVVSTEQLKTGDKPVLKISYQSSNNAAALQFLTAEQTTDKVVSFRRCGFFLKYILYLHCTC